MPEKHKYWPSTLHMGDCAICGNLRDHPIHLGGSIAQVGATLLASEKLKSTISVKIPGCIKVGAELGK